MEQGVMGQMWRIYLIIGIMALAFIIMGIIAYKEDFKNCWGELIRLFGWRDNKPS